VHLGTYVASCRGPPFLASSIQPRITSSRVQYSAAPFSRVLHATRHSRDVREIVLACVTENVQEWRRKAVAGAGGVVVRGRETKGEEARRNACNEHRAAPCSRSSVIVSRRVVVFLGFPRALSRCRPFVCSLVRSLVRLFVRTFVYLFVRSCARTFVRYVSVSTLVDTSFAISRVDFSRRVRGGVVYATCCFLAPRFIADTQPCWAAERRRATADVLAADLTSHPSWETRRFVDAESWRQYERVRRHWSISVRISASSRDGACEKEREKRATERMTDGRLGWREERKCEWQLNAWTDRRRKGSVVSYALITPEMPHCSRKEERMREWERESQSVGGRGGGGGGEQGETMHWLAIVSRATEVIQQPCTEDGERERERERERESERERDRERERERERERGRGEKDKYKYTLQSREVKKRDSPLRIN